MELRHVRTFLALVEELHFGRAARRLRVAQSAVSQTIRALEEEVGAELFARTKRSVSLTPAGVQLVHHARRALDELERGTSAARSAAAGETGRLLLRFSMLSPLTLMPRVVATFLRQYPRVELQIEPAGSPEQLAAIRTGQCDLGFVPSFKEDLAPLAIEPVERAELVAVVPRRHPLARRSSIALRDLAGERFIFLRQSSEPQVRTLFWRHCAQAGFQPDLVIEIEQVEALLTFVAAGIGVSCAPRFVERLDFRGVALIPLAPQIQTGISVVWNPQRLPATAARFLDLLRAEIAASHPPAREGRKRSRARNAGNSP